MGFIDKIKKINKIHICFVTVVGFGAYMTFFSDYNYMQTSKYTRQANQLQLKIKNAKDSAEIYREKLRALNSTPEMVEKVVREEYHMKKPNEDVYLPKEK